MEDCLKLVYETFYWKFFNVVKEQWLLENDCSAVSLVSQEIC